MRKGILVTTMATIGIALSMTGTASANDTNPENRDYSGPNSGFLNILTGCAPFNWEKSSVAGGAASNGHTSMCNMAPSYQSMNQPSNGILTKGAN